MIEFFPVVSEPGSTCVHAFGTKWYVCPSWNIADIGTTLCVFIEQFPSGGRTTSSRDPNNPVIKKPVFKQTVIFLGFVFICSQSCSCLIWDGFLISHSGSERDLSQTIMHIETKIISEALDLPGTVSQIIASVLIGLGVSLSLNS
jgi:hypothetical protein